MEQHHIKTKVGVHEFEATGPKEVVDAQFQAWLLAIAAQPAAAAAAPAAPIPPDFGALKPVSIVGPVSPEALDKMFRKGETLSLAALPSGENAKGEAMLVLLYGYHKIVGDGTVTGSALMKSAAMSGVSVDRADRILDAFIPDLVLAAGVKRARRYQLNNRGLARAEAIIKATVE